MCVQTDIVSLNILLLVALPPVLLHFYKAGSYNVNTYGVFTDTAGLQEYSTYICKYTCIGFSFGLYARPIFQLLQKLYPIFVLSFKGNVFVKS